MRIVEREAILDSVRRLVRNKGGDENSVEFFYDMSRDAYILSLSTTSAASHPECTWMIFSHKEYQRSQADFLKAIWQSVEYAFSGALHQTHQEQTFLKELKDEGYKSTKELFIEELVNEGYLEHAYPY